MNVSAGTAVTATCATADPDFRFSTFPTINKSKTVVTHPNGGTQHTLTFTVPLNLFSVVLRCFAIKGVTTDERLALILSEIWYCLT